MLPVSPERHTRPVQRGQQEGCLGDIDIRFGRGADLLQAGFDFFTTAGW
jgi:hypothetical protein